MKNFVLFPNKFVRICKNVNFLQPDTYAVDKYVTLNVHVMNRVTQIRCILCPVECFSNWT